MKHVYHVIPRAPFYKTYLVFNNIPLESGVPQPGRMPGMPGQMMTVRAPMTGMPGQDPGQMMTVRAPMSSQMSGGMGQMSTMGGQMMGPGGMNQPGQMMGPGNFITF